MTDDYQKFALSVFFSVETPVYLHELKLKKSRRELNIYIEKAGYAKIGHIEQKFTGYDEFLIDTVKYTLFVIGYSIKAANEYILDRAAR